MTQTSKVLNYMDSPIVAPYFGTFIIAWIYLRHYLNLLIIWSSITEFRTVGELYLDWEGQFYKSTLGQVIMLGLLGGLQAVNLFWLYLILKIAVRYLTSRGEELDDVRSEDEGDEDEVAVTHEKTKASANG